MANKKQTLHGNKNQWRFVLIAWTKCRKMYYHLAVRLYNYNIDNGSQKLRWNSYTECSYRFLYWKIIQANWFATSDWCDNTDHLTFLLFAADSLDTHTLFAAIIVYILLSIGLVSLFPRYFSSFVLFVLSWNRVSVDFPFSLFWKNGRLKISTIFF